MTTLLEILTKGTAYLEKKSVDSPRLTMELMVAHSLKMQRMQLYLEFERPLTDEELAPLRAMLKRRGEREPLQHILGSVEFYDRDFICDARALIPRPETEELVAHILKLKLPENPKILDLCTGSGVIGLSLKGELPSAQVTLADISSEALALAQENATSLQLDVEIIESDLFQNIDGAYDLIVCNPPYVSSNFTVETEVTHDPDISLFSGEDGLDFIRNFVPQALSYLKPNGFVALEIGYDQAEAVSALLTQEGYINVEVKSDIEGVPRFPIASSPA